MPFPVAGFLGDLVADAGADQCVQATGSTGAQVTLDASATRDLAGAVTGYTWVSAATGCPIATGSTADVVLPVGTSDLVLQATDAQGNTSSDEVIVSVAAP